MKVKEKVFIAGAQSPRLISELMQAGADRGRRIAELEAALAAKQNLLARYMAVVIAAEGISYVDEWHEEVEGLTPTELVELKTLAGELQP